MDKVLGLKIKIHVFYLQVNTYNVRVMLNPIAGDEEV